MMKILTRRHFALLASLGAITSPALFAAGSLARRIKIGHTGITWGYDSLQAVQGISALGHYGFETFGSVPEKWEADRDYLPLVRHMHLKDYDGGPNFVGYCPLGQGKVNIPSILDLVESANMDGMIMVELDPSRVMPVAAGETARIAQANTWDGMLGR